MTQLDTIMAEINQGEMLDGDILYLSVDDGEDRIVRRARKMLEGRGVEVSVLPPGKITLATAWPVLDERGISYIRDWLNEHPAAILVIVDLWRSIRPSSANRDPNDDYTEMHLLKRLADEYGIAVLAVHHLRKAGSSDKVDTVSSTLGLPGAADLILFLGHNPKVEDSLLEIISRDSEDASYDVRLGSNLEWEIIGVTKVPKPVDSIRQKVLAEIAGANLTVVEIVEILEEEKKTIQNALTYLRRKEWIKVNKKTHKYSLTELGEAKVGDKESS